MIRSRSGVHVDELGNVSMGPPLPLPRMMDNALASSSKFSFVNLVGSESQIPPPLSGRALVDQAFQMGGNGLRNPLHDVHPVNNGLHYGHVMNDPNNSLDERQLLGSNQMPMGAATNMAFGHLMDPNGTMFTSQRAAGAARVLPYAPAPTGGLARAGSAGVGMGRTQQTKFAEKGGGSVYNESVNNVKENRLAEQIHGNNTSFGSVTHQLKSSGKLAGTGNYNNLEVAGSQAARVLKQQIHHSKKGGSKKKKMPSSYKKGKKHSMSFCKKCYQKGKACKTCRHQ